MHRRGTGENFPGRQRVYDCRPIQFNFVPMHYCYNFIYFSSLRLTSTRVYVWLLNLNLSSICRWAYEHFPVGLSAPSESRRGFSLAVPVHIKLGFSRGHIPLHFFARNCLGRSVRHTCPAHSSAVPTTTRAYCKAHFIEVSRLCSSELYTDPYFILSSIANILIASLRHSFVVARAVHARASTSLT